MPAGTIIVTLGAIGGLLALLSGGGSKSKSRPPFTGQLPMPGRDAPWDPVDEAFCKCIEVQPELAGMPLAQCALQRVYPEAPWPARPSDSVSMRAVQAAVFARAALFSTRRRNGDNPCTRRVDPVPPQTCPPGMQWDPQQGMCVTTFVGPPQAPQQPAGFEPISPFRANPAPGWLYKVRQADNPTKVAHVAYGTKTGSAAERDATMNLARSGWNLLWYSRPRAPGTYGSALIDSVGKWYDVGPAFLPANDDIVALYDEQGARIHRQVSWGGAKLHNGAYGTLWIPTEVHHAGADPWSPELNPPADVLAHFGLTLAGMRASWESGQ